MSWRPLSPRGKVPFAQAFLYMYDIASVLISSREDNNNVVLYFAPLPLRVFFQRSPPFTQEERFKTTNAERHGPLLKQTRIEKGQRSAGFCRQRQDDSAASASRRYQESEASQGYPAVESEGLRGG